MSLQREDPLVDGVNDPGRLREEGIFQFVGRSDPVAGTHHDRGSVKVVECQFRNVGSQVAHEGASCRRIP